MDTIIDINTCPICESRVLKHAKKFIITAAVEMYTETALVCLVLTLNL